jgi:hypothetical protein
LFLLWTGCRSSEAAYVIVEKSIVANDYHVPHLKFRFKATAPASITKTKRDYFWLLPAQLDSVVPLIR